VGILECVLIQFEAALGVVEGWVSLSDLVSIISMALQSFFRLHAVIVLSIYFGYMVFSVSAISAVLEV